MTAFVALFRGINVGGRVVKMNDLKDLHASLGFKDVLPYIQSGNVVFTSDEADEAQIRRHIEESFEHKFGYHVEVLVRTSAEISEIIQKNPFQNQPDKESNWVVVLFLAARPGDTAWQDLVTTYTGPEELYITGKEVYIYYSGGIGRSKLTLNLMEKKLKTVGTARNWNTVLKLRELLSR
ncbi:MAG TPA: DUF1697 domain-containing protein [Ktedonobacteraceae bacterium]|nr:DUF1697 domain-containing protein [Ktedonobacteraceae bacterium]